MYIDLRGILDPQGQRQRLNHTLPSPLEKKDQGNVQVHARGAYAAHIQKVAKKFDLRMVGRMRSNVLLQTNLGNIRDCIASI